MSEITVAIGLPDGQETQAAVLYDAAFGSKLQWMVPDALTRQAIFAESMIRERAVVALRDGQVVGLAGFHHDGRALTDGGSFGTLRRHLGGWRAARAALGFALLERRPAPGELLMDGLAVDPDCRGQGLGTRLLHTLFDHGRSLGYRTVRLDVIGRNVGARRLYEREGFEAGAVERLGVLRHMFGFDESTTMVKRLE